MWRHNESRISIGPRMTVFTNESFSCMFSTAGRLLQCAIGNGDAAQFTPVFDHCGGPGHGLSRKVRGDGDGKLNEQEFVAPSASRRSQRHPPNQLG